MRHANVHRAGKLLAAVRMEVEGASDGVHAQVPSRSRSSCSGSSSFAVTVSAGGCRDLLAEEAAAFFCIFSEDEDDMVVNTEYRRTALHGGDAAAGPPLAGSTDFYAARANIAPVPPLLIPSAAAPSSGHTERCASVAASSLVELDELGAASSLDELDELNNFGLLSGFAKFPDFSNHNQIHNPVSRVACNISVGTICSEFSGRTERCASVALSLAERVIGDFVDSAIEERSIVGGSAVSGASSCSAVPVVCLLCQGAGNGRCYLCRPYGTMADERRW